MGLRLRRLDAFREIDIQYTNASEGGGLLTLVTAALAVVLTCCELAGIFSTTTWVELRVGGREHPLYASPDLRVHFDITFQDLACDHVGIGVTDALGANKQLIDSHSVKKTPVDHVGGEGRPYTDDELFELDKAGVSDGTHVDVDTDWTSRTSGIHHKDFQAVINAHTFTVVYFYARATKGNPTARCSKCRSVAPVWDAFRDQTNAHSESGVRAIRLNCADWQELCAANGLRQVPVVRLYKRGPEALTAFKTMRHADLVSENLTAQAFEKFAQESMAALRPAKAEEVVRHSFFKEGCRVEGHIDVSRVPGTLHFAAVRPKGPDSAWVDLSTTNISHTVNHFSFGYPGDVAHTIPKDLWALHKSLLPEEYRGQASPLDGKTFAATEFHHAPHHYLRLVETHLAVSENSWTMQWTTDSRMALSLFQLATQSRVATVPRHKTPAAVFSYELSAIETVVHSERGREWYDLFTTLLALVGGAFSFSAILSAFVKAAEGKN
eukprot:Rhum_TRINITY_DN25519_c0_g1::Rhum_TRINITY_DN25519_c0_g1_i1::g.182327::m.182327